MAFNASFWTFAQMGPYLIAVPYTQNGFVTGPYLWSNQGASNAFAIPSCAPGCRVGAAVGQFLMMGDLYQTSRTTLFTGTGSQTTYSGVLSAPLLSDGSISDQLGDLTGTFNNGTVTGTGYLSSGTVDYTTGNLS